MSNLTPVQLANKMATRAPDGKRLGGPGTRSKNPARYDRIGRDKKAKDDDH